MRSGVTQEAQTARQGRRVPRQIRDFVVQTKSASLDLSGRTIAELIVGRFGEGAAIDKSTVNRILRSSKSEGVVSPVSANPLPESVSQSHWNDLVSSLNPSGLEPLGIHNYDLAVWRSRPKDPSWPVPEGTACRASDGTITVQVECEERLAWDSLEQHLEGDPFWNAIEDWKKTASDDLYHRLALLQNIVDQIEFEEGIGLPVIPDMPYYGTGEPSVSVRFAFAVYEQVVNRVIGLQRKSLTRDDFRFRDGTLTRLHDYPAISSSVDSDHDIAISWAIPAPDVLSGLTEAHLVSDTYPKAVDLSDHLRRHAERISLMPGLPPGSACDACRMWVS